jgi:hypothetical protein
VADLRQVTFNQVGHFHNGIAFNTVLQHGTGNFQFAFVAAFFDTELFTELQGFSPDLLGPLLFERLIRLFDANICDV